MCANRDLNSYREWDWPITVTCIICIHTFTFLPVIDGNCGSLQFLCTATSRSLITQLPQSGPLWFIGCKFCMANIRVLRRTEFAGEGIRGDRYWHWSMTDIDCGSSSSPMRCFRLPVSRYEPRSSLRGAAIATDKSQHGQEMTAAVWPWSSYSCGLTVKYTYTVFQKRKPQNSLR